jgi:hypothetical protein
MNHQQPRRDEEKQLLLAAVARTKRESLENSELGYEADEDDGDDRGGSGSGSSSSCSCCSSTAMMKIDGDKVQCCRRRRPTHHSPRKAPSSSPQIVPLFPPAPALLDDPHSVQWTTLVQTYCQKQENYSQLQQHYLQARRGNEDEIISSDGVCYSTSVSPTSDCSTNSPSNESNNIMGDASSSSSSSSGWKSRQWPQGQKQRPTAAPSSR